MSDFDNPVSPIGGRSNSAFGWLWTPWVVVRGSALFRQTFIRSRSSASRSFRDRNSTPQHLYRRASDSRFAKRISRGRDFEQRTTRDGPFSGRIEAGVGSNGTTQTRPMSEHRFIERRKTPREDVDLLGKLKAHSEHLIEIANELEKFSEEVRERYIRDEKKNENRIN